MVAAEPPPPASAHTTSLATQPRPPKLPIEDTIVMEGEGGAGGGGQTHGWGVAGGAGGAVPRP